MLFFELYARFFMTGLFSIGGGLATLPFLYDMADKAGWFTASDIADMIAISEIYSGRHRHQYVNIRGIYDCGPAWRDSRYAQVLYHPEYSVIIVIAKFLDSFSDNNYVKWALYGLRAASMGLIVSAGFSVVEVAFIYSGQAAAGSDIISLLHLINIPAVILGVLIFAGMKFFKKIHPVVFIALSAVAGVIFSICRGINKDV